MGNAPALAALGVTGFPVLYECIKNQRICIIILYMRACITQTQIMTNTPHRTTQSTVHPCKHFQIFKNTSKIPLDISLCLWYALLTISQGGYTMNTNKTTPRQREIIQLYTENIQRSKTDTQRKAQQNILKGFVFGLCACGYMSMAEAKDIARRWC